jgi:hypothetical protein
VILTELAEAVQDPAGDPRAPGVLEQRNGWVDRPPVWSSEVT